MCVSPKIFMLKLIPNVMGPLGGDWVLRVEPSRMGIVPLKEGSLVLSATGGHSEKALSMNHEVGPPQTPDLPVP